VIFGFVLSIALTAALLWFLETMDATVRSRGDLFDLTGVPPLALVPHIITASELRAARRRAWLTVGTATAAVCVTVALTHFFYRPLDVLWFTLVHRAGF
jgi:hypothetical protein